MGQNWTPIPGQNCSPIDIEAYGGRRHAVDRVSRDREEVRRLSVSLVGCIQPEPLSSLLLKPDDDGMVARFCPFWPLLSPPRRPVRTSDAGFAERAFGRLYSLKMSTDYEGDPKPDFIPFSETAQAHLDAFTREAYEWEREAEGSGLLVSFVGKANGLSVRIALILTFLDWAASDEVEPPVEISEDYYLRAARFVRDYALPMARMTYAQAALKPVDRAAVNLLQLILAERLPEISAREVYRRKLAGLANASIVKAALEVLASVGRLMFPKAIPHVPGRSAFPGKSGGDKRGQKGPKG